MKKNCLCLDLKDDPKLISEYEDWHKKVWPDILKSIKDSGINLMEIYRLHNRLFMIIEANDEFSFENKAALDAANPVVQKWEEFMWNYQKPLPWAKPGEKWMLMKRIFSVNGDQ